MSEYYIDIFYGKETIKKKKRYDDLVLDPLEEFAKENQKKLEDFAFYYKGSLVKYENNLQIKDSIFGKNEEKKTVIIAVLISSEPIPFESSPEEKGDIKEKQTKNKIQGEDNLEDDEDEEDRYYGIRKRINKIYYNDIICPKCKTTAIIDKYENENELKLKILNCENFHYLDNIKYDQYDDFVFDFSDNSPENLNKLAAHNDLLQCGVCSNNRQNLTPPDDKMYICSCGNNICHECNKAHNEKDHNKIDIDDKNYYCIKHGEKFFSYCFDCNANYCETCEKDHINHEIEKFSSIKPKREYIKELEEKITDQKEKLLNFIETTRILFDEIINTIENYLNSYIMIERALIRRYDRHEFNYQLLRNLRNKKLFDNNIFNKLENLDNKENVVKKFNFLFNDIYIPIKDDKKVDKKNNDRKLQNIDNTMKITYKIGEEQLDRRVKLFDPVFVENNKDKLSVVVNGKMQKELSVYFLNKNNEHKIVVNLYQKKTKRNKDGKDKIAPPITDMSYMFNNCKNLESVDFSNWNTVNITSMGAMFQLCNFNTIPDISKFNTSNLENIRAMFCKCIKMTAIPDMSKWFNTKESNLKNISMLFNGCKSLTKINLSSRWYTTKLEDMSYMFNRCKNLTEIHGLKSFQTGNVKSMCGLFNGCEKLKSESFDFKLTTPNVEDMSIMFQGCKSLLDRIDIRLGETKNLKDISGMFSDCINLKRINTFSLTAENITKMIGVFKNCYQIEYISDIAKWNLSKVENAKGLFYECKKFKQIPKLMNQWKFKKNTNYDSILEKCYLENQDKLKKDWGNNEQKDIIQ